MENNNKSTEGKPERDILRDKRPFHDLIERILLEQHFAGREVGYTLETADKIATRLAEVYAQSNSNNKMLEDIRSSLKARLEGRNEGGDIVVMNLVNAIVKKENNIVPPATNFVSDKLYDGPSCALCGAVMQFKCLSCGNTPALTVPPPEGKE